MLPGPTSQRVVGIVLFSENTPKYCGVRGRMVNPAAREHAHSPTYLCFGHRDVFPALPSLFHALGPQGRIEHRNAA